MGVKNLWRLLLPISRRISIQSLSHQTLAIDASIWLTQISKACRDPETGRLLPNRPHVRIFLLRLMRLLFHEIRPVVVFDGAMPEVKRREIQRRKDRREKLWRDDDDGEEGGRALKRTAKKILVQRLKEWRKKEAALTSSENVSDDKNDSKQQLSSSANNGGAFAAGFVPAHLQTQQKQSDSSDRCANNQIEESNQDEIISINSDDDMQENDHNDDDSENDWEMSHAVQSSINASLSKKQDSSNIHEDIDILPETSNEVIAALPTITRSQWIDSQFRAQRIQSRQECIQSAGNMEEYSSTQLRNFLKGSKLNKRMNDIGALASKTAEDTADGTVEAFSSTVADNAQNVSLEALFGEPDDDDDNNSSDSNVEGGGGFLLPSEQNQSNQAEPKQPNEHKMNEVDLLQESDCDVSGDEQMQVENDSSAHCECNTTARNNREHQQSNFTAFASAQDEWAAWGKGNIDEEVARPGATINTDVTANSTLLQNDDSDSDEDGGTFLTLGHNSNMLPTSSIHRETDGTKVAESNGEDGLESVDWEDGVSNEDVSDEGQERKSVESKKIDGPGHNVQSESSISGSSSVLKCDMNVTALKQDREVIEIQSDNELDWEDGSVNANDNEQNAFQGAKAVGFQSNSDMPVDIAPDNQNIASTTAEDDQSPIQFEDTDVEVSNGDEDVSISAFDTYQAENPNIAALQHAQETASKLTNWAGRAVQRAFASHLEQHKAQDQSDTTVNAVDLSKNEDGNNSPRTTNPEETTNSLSNVTSQRREEFLDTSLEGLNAAHQSILEEEKLMERDMSTITDEMKEDILKLLQLCGIPWVESPAEAEAQCAALEELKLVDGVVTEDSDIFVFGGKKVYKNFFNEQQYVEAYYARDAQKELGLGKNQLVSLAMLLGGDYTDGVKGVGIVNGMEILQAFPVNDIGEGLQEFRDWLDGFGDDPKLPDDDGEDKSTFATRRMQFHMKHKSARTRWIAPADFPSQAIINAYMKPVVDKSDAKFSWSKPNMQGLQQFCAESLGWDQEETDRVVLPVLKVLENKSKQRRLESYFMKYEDGIKFAEVRSKRLQTVIEGIHGNGQCIQQCADRDIASSQEEDGTEHAAKKRKK